MGLTLLTGNRGKGNGQRKLVAARAGTSGNAAGRSRTVELPILR